MSLLPFMKGYIHQIWAVASVRETYSIQANFKDADDIIKIISCEFSKKFTSLPTRVVITKIEQCDNKQNQLNYE